MGLRLFLAVSVAAVALRGNPPDVPTGRMQTQYLQPDQTYVVGIAPNVPTTVVFPAAGLGFQGIGFMRAADTSPQPVQIDHEPGTNYFTVRAIMPNARSDLNVIFEGRIYGFVFVLSDDPTRGLTLLRPPPPSARAKASAKTARVSVTRLVEMLDEAKAYDVIAATYPGYQRNIVPQEKSFRIPYPLFDVVVDRAWRFEEEDTIVLRVVLVNKTPRPLMYRPDALAVKIGERTFFCSVADADGRIPACPNASALETEASQITSRLAAARLAKKHTAAEDRARDRLKEILAAYQTGQAVVYLAITGNPDGTRANISLKNNFNVLLDAAPTK